jgi:ABC-2 type transport system permease protein
MKTPSPAANAVVLSRLPSLGALATLFLLTLRQYVRGRRLLVASVLFAAPSVLAALVNWLAPYPPPIEDLQFGFVFNMIPHALLPLAALLYATGIIQDEVEEQTLTYLLARPLPRWALYSVRWLATLLLICVITTVFTAVAFYAITLSHGNSADAKNSALVPSVLKTSAALAIAAVGYCGLFGLLGLLMRRSLFIGVVYIFLFEGVLASIDTVARRMTVMYHFRVMILRWLSPPNAAKEWSIEMRTAPDAQTCAITLLAIGLTLTVIAAIVFTIREFRMKTPEGV